MNNFWNDLVNALPTHTDDQHLFWTMGDEILSKDEHAINALADFFDEVGYVSSTGYYDPEDDEECGCVDKLTGYYYLTV